MQAPTVDEAYKMIRLLKKRAAKGDGDKIATLQKIIDDANERKASLMLDKFFGGK